MSNLEYAVSFLSIIERKDGKEKRKRMITYDNSINKCQCVKQFSCEMTCI